MDKIFLGFCYVLGFMIFTFGLAPALSAASIVSFETIVAANVVFLAICVIYLLRKKLAEKVHGKESFRKLSYFLWGGIIFLSIAVSLGLSVVFISNAHIIEFSPEARLSAVITTAYSVPIIMMLFPLMKTVEFIVEEK